MFIGAKYTLVALEEEDSKISFYTIDRLNFALALRKTNSYTYETSQGEIV
jgi:hypothetical protein